MLPLWRCRDGDVAITGGCRLGERPGSFAWQRSSRSVSHHEGGTTQGLQPGHPALSLRSHLHG